MLMEFEERITANTIATGDATMIIAATTIIGETIPTTEPITTIGGAEFPGLTNRLIPTCKQDKASSSFKVGRGFFTGVRSCDFGDACSSSCDFVDPSSSSLKLYDPRSYSKQRLMTE